VRLDGTGDSLVCSQLHRSLTMTRTTCCKLPWPCQYYPLVPLGMLTWLLVASLIFCVGCKEARVIGDVFQDPELMRNRNEREVSKLWEQGTTAVTQGRAPFNYIWHNSAETMVNVCSPSLETADGESQI